MPTLTDYIAAREQEVTVNVRVNGVLLVAANPTASEGVPGVGRVRVQKSFSAPVPVCTIEMNRVPAWIRRGQTVTVDAGYNGLTQRIFTGYVQSRNRRIGSGGINALGKLWAAFRTIEIEERSVDGMTVEDAIEGILDDVGITDRALTIPAFTLGTASSPRLERMQASQMLSMLMDIDGCRVYELGTGTVVIRVTEEIPAPVAFKTYTTNTALTARIIDVQDSEDPDYFRDYVSVIGATVVEGVAPDQTSRTITANATLLDSPLVQPPSPSQIEAEYNNHLIDTDAKASEIAIRLLTRYARIPKQVVTTIAGDPQLELGQTIGLTIPEMDIDGRYFVSSIEHTIDKGGFRTTLRDLRGGDELGGTLAQNPIAAFLFHTEREIFGNAVNVVATFNASGSFDPDGTIVSYAWSDNQTTTPEIATFTGAFASVRADTSAWTGDWNVTLTVTDNDGLTHAVTITIPYTNDTVDTIPAVYAALENNASYTLDAGSNWTDISGSTCISVAARPADGVNFGQGLYGFSDGHIARLNAGALTTVMAAVGSAINYVVWDWRNTQVAWAAAADARVFISIDEGVTWVLYDALRTKLGVAGAISGRRCLGLPAAGGIYWVGGTGAGVPMIAYDPVVGSHGWVNQTLTGDLATDTATPADATMRIMDFTAPGNGTAAIILEWASGGGASLVAIYSTVTPPGPTASYTRATGLTAGLKTGRYIVGDDPTATMVFHAGFANRDTWHSANGIAWTQTTNVMPVGVTPNDALFMSDVLTGVPGMQGVYLVAAEDAGGTVGIYKSSDGLATVGTFRPSTVGTAWPASAKGKMVAVGAPNGTAPSAGLCIESGVYAGNGGTLAITGVGFQPDMVIVAREDANNTKGAFFRTSNMPATESYSFPSGVKQTDCIVSLDADGFTLGADTDVNNGAGSYRWVAIKDPGGLGTNMAFGSYVGDQAAAPISITGLGWEPGWVFVKADRAANSLAYQRTPDMAANESFSFAGGAAAVTNGILSLDSDGFTVSNRLDVNAPAADNITFYYVAFKRDSNFLRTGSYTGTAAAKSIFVGMSLGFVMVKGGGTSSGTSIPRWRAVGSGFPDANSSPFAATENDVADGITAFNSGSFNIGVNDDVNESGDTFYWVALNGDC